MSTPRYHGKRTAPRRRTVPRGRSRADQKLTPQQCRRTVQLMVAGGIFVLLVMLKLLLPQRLSGFALTMRESLRQDADFRAAFAAVGQAIAGERAVGDSLQEAYTAVFAPEAYRAAQASAILEAAEHMELPAERLRLHLNAVSAAGASQEATIQTAEVQMTTDQALIYFSTATPSNVSFEQRVLGFPYASPLQGKMTSPFGYREHPIYGGNRFHYGLDLAANRGTAIGAFADGTVKATGESSSLGRYLMITHPNNITTIYAHCDRVVVSAGRQVSQGEKIAEVGSTGAATGPHLHFEILQGDTYLNPIYYVEVH